MPLKQDDDLNPGQQDYEHRFDPENRSGLYRPGEPLTPGEQASLDQIEAGLSEDGRGDLHHSLRNAERDATDGPSYRDEDGTQERKKISSEASGSGGKSSLNRDWKKVAIAYGLSATVVGGIISGIMSLFTMKADFIQNQLDNVINSRVEKTITARTSRLVASYLSQTFEGLTQEKCGKIVTLNCRVQYKGVTKNLFNNWRDVGFEAELRKRGISIDYDLRSDTGTITRTGTITDLKSGEVQEFDGAGLKPTTRGGGKYTFSRELSRAIDEATEDMHGIGKLWMRTGGRYFAARKIGVKAWCLFACDKRQEIRDKRISGTLRVKNKMIEKVIAPVSPKVGFYIECLLQDCGSDKFRSKSKSILENRFEDSLTKEVAEETAEQLAREAGEEIAEEAVEEVIEEATEETLEQTVENSAQRIARDVGDSRLSQIITEKIFNKVFSKVLGTAAGSTAGKVASKAIPVAGWIMLYDLVNTIDKKIDENAFSTYLADMKIQQYLDFYVFHRQATDEMRAGMLNADEIAGLNGIFDGFETSKYYNAGWGGSGSAVFASEGVTCRDGKPIPKEELVCDEQKVGGQAFFESWRDNAVVSTGLKATFYGYRKFAPGIPYPAPPGVPTTETVVHGITKTFDSAVSAVVSPIFSSLDNIPGIKQSMDFIQGLLSPIMDGLIGLFEPILSDTELQNLAFDSVAAGADIFTNSYMRDALGMPRISNEQANALHKEAMDEKRERFQNETFFARVFDINQRGSLSNTLAMRAYESPASNAQFGSSISNVASLLSPNKIISFFGSLFSKPVYAQYNSDVIFGAFENAQSGIAYDGDAMNTDPETLTPEYCAEFQKNWEASVKYDEFTGEPYYENVNMCLLDTSLDSMLSCSLTTAPCEDDPTQSSSSTDTSGPSATLNNVECPSGIKPHPSQDNYFQLPESPSDYSFFSQTPEAQRYGSEQLVCVIYSVSKAYNDFYKGESQVVVGDLNATGHSSHNIGRAVDLWASGAKGAANRDDPAYSPEHTIQLGKLFIDTGTIKNIWWCGRGSNPGDLTSSDGTLEAIREYAEQKGTPVNIKCLVNHHHHFHVDIADEYSIPGNFQP